MLFLKLKLRVARQRENLAALCAPEKFSSTTPCACVKETQLGEESKEGERKRVSCSSVRAAQVPAVGRAEQHQRARSN